MRRAISCVYCAPKSRTRIRWRGGASDCEGSSLAPPPPELMRAAREAAAVRHATLDALGHELRGLAHVRLEVAVAAPVEHRADGSHAAVDLVRAALVEHHLARALVGAREERA